MLRVNHKIPNARKDAAECLDAASCLIFTNQNGVLKFDNTLYCTIKRNVSLCCGKKNIYHKYFMHLHDKGKSNPAASRPLMFYTV